MHTHLNQEWLERSNAEALYHLERQGRTSLGIVPFIGAGLSTAFGFKDWKNLLLSSAPPSLVPRIEKQLNENNYEKAAETLLKELGADGFQNMVAASAGDSNLGSFDFRTGTVSLLPLIASGPVVTTNFDRVLERAFEVNGVPFKSVISGPRPDLIVDAMHGNRRVLIKLHGDWQDRVGRTFAESDYDANYGAAQPERKRELLEGAEELLFSSRSMLFIGASLVSDRTVASLQQVHQRYAGIRHFAIMVVPKKQTALNEKVRHLRTCGVLPLWYQAHTPAEHVLQIEKLVESIVERISVQTIQEPVGDKHKRSSIITASIQTSVRPAPELSAQVNRRAGAREKASCTSRRLRKLKAHFERVVRLIEDGRLTFFLGSAIHSPTSLMAKEFYEELARIFECKALTEERFAVAQYIADRYGRENLYAEIRKLFARTPLMPRDTHELFAAWREFKSHTGERVPYPMVLTTNYDDVLERTLADADLPYHLLSYQADGPRRGLFYHRSPDNSLRIIERPRNIRKLSDGFVLVKLNGGLDHQRRIPESYSTTRLDYWDLAARIPDALPAVVQQTLSAHPLLFLGHGLAAPDIESLVRYAHKDHPGPRSWAIVLKDDGIEYWQQCGVEILSKPVDLYVNELRVRLAGNGPVRVATGAASATRVGARRPPDGDIKAKSHLQPKKAKLSQRSKKD